LSSWGKYLLPAGAVLLAAQLVRVPRDNPPVASDLHAPIDVDDALRHACYDCHSNQTRWPWYSAIAPLSWVIHRDVDEGRKRLNFSNWADYEADPGTRSQKLAEIAKFVAGQNMAPWYYRLLHPDARLTEAQRQAVIRWTERQSNAIPPSS
jgi:Haem-binding domain